MFDYNDCQRYRKGHINFIVINMHDGTVYYNLALSTMGWLLLYSCKLQQTQNYYLYGLLNPQ